MTSAPAAGTTSRPDVVGAALRVLSGVTAGVATGGVVGIIATGDARFLLPMLLGLPLSILIPSVAMVRSTTAGGLTTAANPPSPEPGPWTLGRVMAIRRTGVTVSEQPLCDVDLVVADASSAGGYVTTLRVVVDQVDVPRYQPDCVVVVGLDGRGAATGILAQPPSDAADAAASERGENPGNGRVPHAEGLPRRETTPAPLIPYTRPKPARVLILVGGFAVGLVVVLLYGGVL